MDYIRKTLIVSFIFSIFFLATLQVNNLVNNSNKKVLGVTTNNNTAICNLLNTLTVKYCPNIDISTTSPTFNVGQTTPIVEQISVDNIVAISDSDGKSATIMFTTNKQVVSKLEYGITASSLVLMTTDNVSTSSHQITLSQLRPNTNYYYRIRIGDRIFDNNGMPYMFKTKSQTSDNSVLVTNVVAISSSDGKNVTIKFNTNTPSVAKIEYGTTAASLVLMTADSKPTMNHQLILNQLRTTTNYYYRIRIGNKVYDNGGMPYIVKTKG